MFRKSLLGLTAAVLVCGGTLWGDDKKEPPIKGQLPTLWGKLGLSEEQKQKIYGIQADHRAKIAELREQIRKLEKEEKAEMEKVLTEDQKAQWKKLLLGRGPADKPEEKKPEDKKPEEKKPEEKKPDGK